MKDLLLMLLALAVFFLSVVIFIRSIKNFSRVADCTSEVKAEHAGYMKKSLIKPWLSGYYMKVRYRFDKVDYEVCLLDNKSMHFYETHIRQGEQKVFVNSERPEDAIIYKYERLLIDVLGVIVSFLLGFASFSYSIMLLIIAL